MFQIDVIYTYLLSILSYFAHSNKTAGLNKDWGIRNEGYPMKWNALLRLISDKIPECTAIRSATGSVVLDVNDFYI